MKAMYYYRGVNWSRLDKQGDAPITEEGGMMRAAELNRAMEKRLGLKPRKEREVMCRKPY